MRKLPPYDRTIRVLLLLLLLIYIGRQVLPQYVTDKVMEWAAGLAVVTLLACLFAGYKAVTEMRAGQLYPIRSISLYLTGFTVVLIAIYFLFDVFAATGEQHESLLVWAFITGFFTQSMPYFYADSVRMEHRIATMTTVLPLFGVREVVTQDDSVHVKDGEGNEIALFRGQFSPAAWSEINTRLSELVKK